MKYLLVLILNGCATYAHERTPEYERAYAECQLESRKIGGNDTGERWANQLFFHIECMKLNGY
jgi:hypothetical protein